MCMAERKKSSIYLLVFCIYLDHNRETMSETAILTFSLLDSTYTLNSFYYIYCILSMYTAYHGLYLCEAPSTITYKHVK